MRPNRLPVLIFFSTHASAFNSAACCNLAQSRNAFLDPPPPTNISCGNTYINDTIPAATSLFVSYQFCKSECPGYRKSGWGSPSEWAAPIVQFLLPSIIFSMSIPRPIQFLSTEILEEMWIDDATGQFARLAISLLLLPLAMACAILDTVTWVVIIMSMAGPMMVAGLHEAMLDYKILSALVAGKATKAGIGEEEEEEEEEELTAAVELLVTVVSGNLRLDGNIPEPSEVIAEALTGRKHTDEETQTALVPQGTVERENAVEVTNHHQSTTEEARATTQQQKPPAPPPERLLVPHYPPSCVQHIPERLTRLITSQLPFGAIVGAPVVFYLGSFIYTVLDLLDNPSDQDRAISIAYGVEWMIIVHVAIVSGTLLASNNPSPVTLLVGRGEDKTRKRGWPERVFPPVYGGVFETVPMWRRGVNKRAWLARTRAWNGVEGFKEAVRIGKWGWTLVGFFTVVLISLPAAAGAFVSWRTPPVGWSCRSLSFVLYMGFEIVLTPLYFCWLEARGEKEVVAWWGGATKPGSWERDMVSQVGLFLVFLLVLVPPA